MNMQSIMMNAMQNAMGINKPQNQNQNQMPAFNPDQMRQMLPRISSQQMEQFKQQARNMGITEQQISDGLALLNKLR